MFMVAASRATVDVAVDHPVSTAQPKPGPDNPISWRSRQTTRWRCATPAIAEDGLVGALAAASGGDKEERCSTRKSKP
jgi:biopolymer transport protein ExbD